MNDRYKEIFGRMHEKTVPSDEVIEQLFAKARELSAENEPSDTERGGITMNRTMYDDMDKTDIEYTEELPEVRTSRSKLIASAAAIVLVLGIGGAAALGNASRSLTTSPAAGAASEQTAACVDTTSLEQAKQIALDVEGYTAEQVVFTEAQLTDYNDNPAFFIKYVVKYNVPKDEEGTAYTHIISPDGKVLYTGTEPPETDVMEEDIVYEENADIAEPTETDAEQPTFKKKVSADDDTKVTTVTVTLPDSEKVEVNNSDKAIEIALSASGNTRDRLVGSSAALTDTVDGKEQWTVELEFANSDTIYVYAVDLDGEVTYYPDQFAERLSTATQVSPPDAEIDSAETSEQKIEISTPNHQWDISDSETVGLLLEKLEYIDSVKDKYPFKGSYTEHGGWNGYIIRTNGNKDKGTYFVGFDAGEENFSTKRNKYSLPQELFDDLTKLLASTAPDKGYALTSETVTEQIFTDDMLKSMTSMIFIDFNGTNYEIGSYMDFAEQDRSLDDKPFDYVVKELDLLKGTKCADPELSGWYTFTFTTGDNKKHDLIMTGNYISLDGTMYYSTDPDNGADLAEYFRKNGG